jgi:NhaP-type Na+/H+ or K+/H+ antiporter
MKKNIINIVIGALLGVVITWLFAKWLFAAYPSDHENPLSVVYIFIVFVISTGVLSGIVSRFNR